MDNQKKRKRRDTSLRMAVGFVLFILCFGALLIILTVRALTPKPSLPQGEDNTASTQVGGNGNGNTDTPPEEISKPVFSGGAMGTLPHKTADTVSLDGELSSAFGILLDAESGAILVEKGGNTRFNPASMTKVMTLIVMCEMLTEDDLEKEVAMTSEMSAYLYTNTGPYAGVDNQTFDVGDRMKIKDLLYGIGVESYADCTMLVVGYLFDGMSPSVAEERFVAEMQKKVAAMGLADTHFDNVIGHESDNNYSTAADIAAIMSYALRSPLIKRILSAKTHTIPILYTREDGTEDDYNGYFYSTLFNANDGNSRIKQYENVYGSFSLKSPVKFSGGKTGSLGGGGQPWLYSLVSFAEKNGKVYIAVTGELEKNGYDVMKDAKTLYDNYIP